MASMRPLERWFRRERTRLDRAVFLEDALLGGRAAAYCLYRLRYFLGRSLVSAAIHLVEFAFLSFIFSGQALAVALVVRALAGFISSWWWGAMEPLRTEVRGLYRERRRHLIPARLPGWLRSSGRCAVLLLAVAAGAAGMDLLRPGRSFDPLHLYVLATGLRLALSLPAWTFHSAVFAVRRVWRPFLAIVGVELFTFCGAMVLWPALGRWSYPVVLLPGAVLSSGLTYYYVYRMYRLLYPGPARPAGRRTVPRSRGRIFRRETVLAGLGFAFSHLDHILVMALAHGALRHPRGWDLLLLFHVIGPFVRSASEWARLFYFDLKRLEPALLDHCRRRFSRIVRRVAVAVACFYWICSCLCATVLLHRNLGGLYLLLAAFFIVRSLLAFLQVRAFTEGRHGVLVATGMLILSAVLLARALVSGEEVRLAILVLAMAGAIPCLFLLRRRTASDGKTAGRRLALLDWLHHLVRLSHPVRICSAQIDPRASRWLTERVLADVARTLGPGGSLALVGPRRVAWCESPARAGPLPPCGGLLSRLRRTPVLRSGREALAAARRTGVLASTILEPAPAEAAPPSPGAVGRRFRGLFPNGVIHEAGSGGTAPAAPMSAADRRAILFGALQYPSAAFFRPLRRADWDVTALCIDGAVRLLFGIPQGAPRRDRIAWRSFINQANVHHALHSKRAEGEVLRMSHHRLTRMAAALCFLVLLAALPWWITVEDHAAGTFHLRPDARTEIRAPVAGFLRSIAVAEGDRVPAGMVLARFEVPDLESRIAQKEAEINEVRAMIRTTASEAGPRTPVTRPPGGAAPGGPQSTAMPASPEEELRTRDLLMEDPSILQRARLARLREQLKLLLKTREAQIIRCPVEGIIATPRLAERVGRYLDRGEFICAITAASSLQAELLLPEQEAARVRPGQRILLKARARPFETFQATVDRIAPVAAEEPERSMVRLHGRLEAPVAGLLPGSSGYARVCLGRQSLGSLMAGRVMRFIRTEFWW
jgi:multidrug resistance efflux pump